MDDDRDRAHAIEIVRPIITIIITIVAGVVVVVVGNERGETLGRALHASKRGQRGWLRKKAM
jgi:Sec-independent protein translocase protein TatA